MAAPDLRQIVEAIAAAIYATDADNRFEAISLSWTITPLDNGKRIDIKWREEGGPAVSAPTRFGFCTREIRSALSCAKEGSVDLEFEASGLRCDFRFQI